MRHTTARFIVLLLIAPMSAGCSVYRISSDNGGVAGVPFYVRSAECRQETIWQEDVRRVTLQVIGAIPARGTTPPSEKTAISATRLVRAADLARASGLRENVYGLSSAHQILALMQEFEQVREHDPAQWRENPELVLASNVNAMHSFVDYSQRYYFNGARPIMGSAAVSTELGADGTLAKASAEVDSETAETLLSQLPIKEVLTSRLIPAPAALSFDGTATATDYRAALTIENVPVQHKLARTTALATPCAQLAAIPAASTEAVSYTRTTLGSAVQAPATPSNAIGITGQIVLPNPKK